MKFVILDNLIKANASVDPHHKAYSRRNPKSGKMEQIKQKGSQRIDEKPKVQRDKQEQIKSKVKLGDSITVESGTAKITAVGKDGVTARDDKNKVYKIEHSDVNFAKEKTEETKFSDSTLEHRLESATWSDIQSTMNKDLEDISTLKINIVNVSGKFSKKLVPIIRKNMKRKLSSYTTYLAGETVNLVHQYIDLTEQLLEKYSKEFKHIDSKTINNMCIDSVKKLVFQEIQSNRQQFTDHGIRHIVKNTIMQQSILDQFEKSGIKLTGMDRLIGCFSMINHDVGYAAKPIRQGGADAVKSSKEHKQYSAKIAEAQRKLWNKDKIFSGNEYNKIVNIVENHDSTDLNMKNPVQVATSIADNLSLFQKEKLPSMFKYVPKSKDILLRMGKASKEQNEKEFSRLKTEMSDMINLVDKFGEKMKRDLRMAVNEISYFTPKFTMGVLAGEMGGVETSKEGLISIDINYNKFDKILQKFFDMGQRQTKKLLEDYGEKDFEKDVYRLGNFKGKSILELKIKKGGKV